MKIPLWLTNCVWPIKKEEEKTIQGFSFGIAGASFASILAIIAIPEHSWETDWATLCFSASLPLALLWGFVNHSLSLGGWSTRGTRILVFAAGNTTRVTVFSGTVLLVYRISHIAAAILGSLSVLALIFYVGFCGTYHKTCAGYSERDRNNPGLPAMQPPLPSPRKKRR